LHDIGKVGVPEAILNKPARLTAEEFARIREHPVVGERILAPIIRQRGILTAIRGHHERLDGSGYPDGLKGERISLLARIIAIADCFDAMTSARAYREGMSVAEALEELRAGAGRQFEHSFVQSFVEVSNFFRMRKHTSIGREPAATVPGVS
jgi:HD-GYP domain-containing protein (c-di-GMP phosphodiesterase class II)